MVTVRVPATTANLAAGFDSMGCALGLYNTLSFSPAEMLSFTGCDTVYQNEENLAYRAYCRVLQVLGLKRENVAIDIDAKIPVSRGLGSSAALLVAGAVAANALHGSQLDKRELLSLCTELEGHPDNVAPALFGGLTASFMADSEVISVSYPVHPELRFVAMIPDFPLSTHAARSVLPSTVSYADAVFNTAHAAVLPGAFAQGDEMLLAAALQDRLHQPYRRSLIHEYGDVEAIAAENGCSAFCISGAGPTLLALTKDPAFAYRMAEGVRSLSCGWRVMELPVDFEGAAIAAK
ncbi:MAG: homoserine kinase [Oscillospiraceae bacterium]|nr:homoserine kinase [Oscillospiraceae bacterium]